MEPKNDSNRKRKKMFYTVTNVSIEFLYLSSCMYIHDLRCRHKILLMVHKMALDALLRHSIFKNFQTRIFYFNFLTLINTETTKNTGN